MTNKHRTNSPYLTLNEKKIKYQVLTQIQQHNKKHNIPYTINPIERTSRKKHKFFHNSNSKK